MTIHHCFCTWWCKFRCSILYEMCEILLTKLLLKLNPVTSVKGNSFNWHSFFGVNKKVTPLCTSTAHLALNLGIVSMGSFSWHMLPTLSQKNLGSKHQPSRGLTWNFVSGHLTAISPKESELGSITFPSGEHPRIVVLEYTTNPLFLNMYWCFLAVHVFVIFVNCY